MVVALVTTAIMELFFEMVLEGLIAGIAAETAAA
jgi:hypothetical protein